MKRHIAVVFILIMLATIGSPMAVLADERDDGGYFTVVEEEDRQTVIFQTAMLVHEGDMYLTADNKLYKVVKVEKDTGYARFVREVDLAAAVTEPQESGLAVWWKEVTEWGTGKATSTAAKRRLIGIYHTHSDESYLDTEGKASVEGEGGIYDVGKALADSLRKQGLQVIQSQNNHNPHDINAYHRSQKTVAQLLKQGPDALFDVHRDALPPEAYSKVVNGQQISQVQLVIGRENPNMKANEAFAFKLKQAADQKYPGLIKGLFYGKAAFNQELFPRSILIEIGSHTNAKQTAIRGVSMFGEIVPTALYGPAAAKPASGTTSKAPFAPGTINTKPPTTPGGGGFGRALLWLIGLAVLGGGGYLLLSTGGLKEAGSKLRKLGGREFSSFLGKPRGERDTGGADREKQTTTGENCVNENLYGEWSDYDDSCQDTGALRGTASTDSCGSIGQSGLSQKGNGYTADERSDDADGRR